MCFEDFIKEYSNLTEREYKLMKEAWYAGMHEGYEAAYEFWHEQYLTFSKKSAIIIIVKGKGEKINGKYALYVPRHQRLDYYC